MRKVQILWTIKQAQGDKYHKVYIERHFRSQEKLMSKINIFSPKGNCLRSDDATWLGNGTFAIQKPCVALTELYKFP